MNALLSTAAVTATAIFSLTTADASVWIQNFGESPYSAAEGNTIIGVANWQTSVGGSSASTNAVIVEVPAVSENTILRLKKAVSGDSPVRIKNSSFTPITGETRVSVGLAFDFNPASNSSTRVNVGFTDLSQTSSPLTFGIDFSTNGGLFYTFERMGESGPEIVPQYILSKSEIKMNSLYTFTFDIDIPTRSFSVTVSGNKADDSPFSYTLSDLRSGNFGSSINLIYLESTANQNFTTYVDHVAFQAIPEPSTAMLLFGAGAASVGVSFFRSTRNR